MKEAAARRQPLLRTGILIPKDIRLGMYYHRVQSELGPFSSK
ncbi:hypothetical protein A8990_102246 [Paenibacillus taihuensis]|uniref:Uncharacterized protein n=1 Tax=Paenibacillus taihuensis TaxID=1156355 RepID=A0A3D9SE75_9BACL|nr:hypothetical protein A8990_102246 [Paenibacillus taihuensis]